MLFSSMKNKETMNNFTTFITNELESILRRKIMKNNCLNFEDLVDKKCHKIIELLKEYKEKLTKINNYPIFVHCELTNKCNKVPGCWMCGRRKIEKEYPHLANFNKDMDLDLAKSIIDQLPKNTIVHFHNNGEPTVYPYLKEILEYSKNKVIRHFDSNCILLVKRADDIIDNLEVLTASVIENDPLQDEQFEIVKEFLKIKKDRKPRVVFRLLGDVGKLDAKYKTKYLYGERINRWYDLAEKYNCTIATRTLHSPMGSFDYEKKVTIPEYAICNELLTHLAIDVDGDVFPCVRFNPLKLTKLGNVKKDKLIDIWNGEKRQKLIQLHIEGKRDKIDLCSQCDYWGIPIG